MRQGSMVAVLGVVLGCLGVWSGAGWVQVVTEVPRIQGPLTIFTAASLTEVFKEMGTRIEQANPGTKIGFNFAGSSTLRMQLTQGARADAFAAADEPNMQGAQQDGTIASEPRIFVRNQLVAIVPASHPAKVTRLQELAKPGVKLVLTNKGVPVGHYARQALAKMSQASAFGTDFATRVPPIWSPRTLLLDSGVLCSRVVREAQVIFKAIEK